MMKDFGMEVCGGHFQTSLMLLLNLGLALCLQVKTNYQRFIQFRLPVQIIGIFCVPTSRANLKTHMFQLDLVLSHGKSQVLYCFSYRKLKLLGIQKPMLKTCQGDKITFRSDIFISQLQDMKQVYCIRKSIMCFADSKELY